MRLPLAKMTHLHPWKLRLPRVFDFPRAVKHSLLKICQRQTQLQLPCQKLEQREYFLAKRCEVRDD
ncbi:MAG TPA: hypothetical protein PKA23_12895, partial [Accumulibacter sp.]|nr:hypothetical protein [Accumulibacter sp.]